MKSDKYEKGSLQHTMAKDIERTLETRKGLRIFWMNLGRKEAIKEVLEIIDKTEKHYCWSVLNEIKDKIKELEK